MEAQGGECSLSSARNSNVSVQEEENRGGPALSSNRAVNTAQRHSATGGWLASKQTSAGGESEKKVAAHQALTDL